MNAGIFLMTDIGSQGKGAHDSTPERSEYTKWCHRVDNMSDATATQSESAC